MAASALTTATAAALTSTLPDNAPKSAQQSPRNTASASTVAVRACTVEVSKALQDGEKFIKWDEVSDHLYSQAHWHHCSWSLSKYLCSQKSFEAFFLKENLFFHILAF